MITVGLIGAGRIGRIHAEHLANRIRNCNLLIIADSRPDVAEQCADDLDVALTTDRYEDVIEHPGVDAVIVCSATDTHATIIEQAARNGKHIFCEKPIDHDLARIDWALDAVEEAGVQLQIGFNRRFDPSYRRVREAIQRGEIGTPHLLHLISRDPGPPPIDYIRSSGGLFLDMAIHDFDMARFLIGSEVEKVYATGGVRIDPAIGEAGDIDTALTVLHFENGVVGTIDNSRKAVYGYDQRAEVFGSGGRVSTDNVYPHTATIDSAEGIRRDLPLHFFLERYAESYLLEMQAFIDALESRTDCECSGHDGRLPVLIALAAKRSLEEGRPVEVTEIDA